MDSRNPWTLDVLKTYLGQEESTGLEFKSCLPLHGGTASSECKKFLDDLSCEVGAMLNGDGGLVLVGINETSQRQRSRAGLAESIEGVARSKMSGHRLSSMICDRIHPAVASLVQVHTVKVGQVAESATEDLLAFVIEVRPGTTAYQSADKRYYVRRTTEAVAMEDKDVRLRMLADDKPRAAVRWSRSVFPGGEGWESYRDAFTENAAWRAKFTSNTSAASTAAPPLTEEQVLELSKKLDQLKLPRIAAKTSEIRVHLDLVVENVGISTIRRLCVALGAPSSSQPEVKLVLPSQRPAQMREGVAVYDLELQEAVQVPLYPEMSSEVLSCRLEFPRTWSGDACFDQALKAVVYLDGGLPCDASVDLVELMRLSKAEFLDRAEPIEALLQNA